MGRTAVGRRAGRVRAALIDTVNLRYNGDHGNHYNHKGSIARARTNQTLKQRISRNDDSAINLKDYA